MNYQQHQSFWISQQWQENFNRRSMTASPSYYPTHSTLQHKKHSRSLPLSGPILSKQGYHYGNNNIVPEQQRQQEQVYHCNYGAPSSMMLQQQPPSSPHHHYAPPSPRKTDDHHIDCFQRAPTDELSRKHINMTAPTTRTRMMSHRKMSLEAIPSSRSHYYNKMSSFQHNNRISPGFYHHSSTEVVPRNISTVSSQYQFHYRIPTPSPPMSQQQEHHHQQQTVSYRRPTNLARITSTITHNSTRSDLHGCKGSSPTTSVFQNRCNSSEGPKGSCRVNNGRARKITPFQMASITEEKRSNSNAEEDEEVPLALLASNNNKHQRKHYHNTYPTMKKHSQAKQQQCASIKMTSRSNSAGTESSSSRPSFFSKISNNSDSPTDESGLTSNCSMIHQEKHESPLSPSPSVVANPTLKNEPEPFKVYHQEPKKQQRQRKISVTKRLFSSMHRLSRAVLNAPVSSLDVKK